jgi:hypothetical protein
MNNREIKLNRILQEIAEIAFAHKDETLKNTNDKLTSFSTSANFHFGIAEIKFTYNRK